LDIHLTLYSSCAIEAPFLGIPNILINIRNFAKSYYSDLLNEKNSIILEDGNYKEFSKAVEHLKQFSRDEVKQSFRYIRPNYNRNLDSFLNKLNLRGENPLTRFNLVKVWSRFCRVWKDWIRYFRFNTVRELLESHNRVYLFLNQVFSNLSLHNLNRLF